MEELQNNLLTDINLQADEHVKRQFTEAGKWSRFIAIVMFVFAALILVFGVAGGNLLASTFEKLAPAYGDIFKNGGAIIIAIVVLVAIVMGGIYYFLYVFGRKIKTAMLSENAEEMAAALKMLKIYFVVTTIFAILSLLNEIKNIF